MTALTVPPAILVSHVGYGSRSAGAAIVVAHPGSLVRTAVALMDGRRIPLALDSGSSVPGWGPAAYSRVDLAPALAAVATDEVSVVIEVEVDGSVVSSQPVVVAPHRLQSTIADVTAYFRSQRSSGEIDRKDRRAAFYGVDSDTRVDARGGWLDASGDTSKFLSHLTYTRMMSPQQIPLCAWALLRSVTEIDVDHSSFVTSQRTRLRDEGLFGADFLVRFQDPSGFFYTGIFDALTKRLDERVITAPLQESVRTTRWQASYRHGGGLAIAALALASTADDSGEFSADRYLEAARRGFLHLEEHNADYLFDGQESVLDDYCALLAATELAAAARVHGTDDTVFTIAARRRAESLTARISFDDRGGAFLVGDVEGRPYFHAAESGLPLISLLRFAEVFDDGQASRAAFLLLDGLVRRTDGVDNPFGLVRQLATPTGQEPADAFFFPHDNETGYWWQGENANLGSVAYAATVAARLPDCDPELAARSSRLAADSLAWILGRNPFDACMLQGRGHGSPEYSGEYQNSPGGIVNGITSGFTDEGGIAFAPVDAPNGEEWRWAEQWIPHSGWFVLAVAAAR